MILRRPPFLEVVHLPFRVLKDQFTGSDRIHAPPEYATSKSRLPRTSLGDDAAASPDANLFSHLSGALRITHACRAQLHHHPPVWHSETCMLGASLPAMP